MRCKHIGDAKPRIVCYMNFRHRINIMCAVLERFHVNIWIAFAFEINICTLDLNDLCDKQTMKSQRNRFADGQPYLIHLHWTKFHWRPLAAHPFSKLTKSICWTPTPPPPPLPPQKNEAKTKQHATPNQIRWNKVVQIVIKKKK